MAKVMEWLDDNIEDLYESFIKSKPNMKRLQFINRWNNNAHQKLDNKKQLSPAHVVDFISITKFR